jgi:hypothetical protein
MIQIKNHFLFFLYPQFLILWFPSFSQSIEILILCSEKRNRDFRESLRFYDLELIFIVLMPRKESKKKHSTTRGFDQGFKTDPILPLNQNTKIGKAHHISSFQILEPIF